jgi:hypothetical protein
MLLLGRVSMRIKYNLIQDRIYIAGREDLYPSPHTLCMTKSRKMKSVVHVARMRGKQNAFSVLWGNLKEEDNLKGLDVDGMMILN